MTSELKKTKANQDLTFRYVLAQHKVSYETAKHLILTHSRWSQEVPTWSPMVLNLAARENHQEALKNCQMPRPMKSAGWSPEISSLCSPGDSHAQPGCTLLMYPMKAILYLDSFDFSKFHQGKGFLEKGTVVLLLKTQLTV